MAENYGLPYTGSKSKIAHWVIDNLPRGRVLRLVCARIKDQSDLHIGVQHRGRPIRGCGRETKNDIYVEQKDV